MVCLLLIVYMMVFYYRKPHIPIKSTRIFQNLTGVAFLVALFDLITIYTVNNRDIIPNGVNLIAHIIYLMSLLGFIYLLFLYMRSYLEAGRKFSKTVKLLQSLPFLVSAVGIIVLPITYVHGKTTDYSLGPKAYALYASVVLYLLLICILLFPLLGGDGRREKNGNRTCGSALCHYGGHSACNTGILSGGCMCNPSYDGTDSEQ